MTDEVATLRARLRRGDWTAVVDPLLTLALLEDAGDWWGEARHSCSFRVLMVSTDLASPDERASALEAWRLDIAPDAPPPAAWAQRLTDVREGDRGHVGAAFDELMFLSGVVQGVEMTSAARRLARRILERLPAARQQESAPALAALDALERWPSGPWPPKSPSK